MTEGCHRKRISELIYQRKSQLQVTIAHFTVEVAEDRVVAISGVNDKSPIFRYNVLTAAN